MCGFWGGTFDRVILDIGLPCNLPTDNTILEKKSDNKTKSAGSRVTSAPSCHGSSLQKAMHRIGLPP